MVTVKARTLKITTFTSEVNLLILREHTSSFYNDTSKFNQSIQVDLTQLTKLVLYWQTANSNIDFVMD